MGMNSTTILGALGLVKKGMESTSVKSRETYQFKKFKSVFPLVLLIF